MAIKLYNRNSSHFAAKCRIAILEKDAPVEIAEIPGGDLESPEYLRIYGMGKTPALDADGVIIGESEIINEYLEERFPTPPLLPADPVGRARARAIGRFVDLYLEPPFYALFPQVMGKAEQRDQALIAARLAEAEARLERLEDLLSPAPYAVGSAFTLADCSLAPLMLYVDLTLRALDARALMDRGAKRKRWWEAVKERPSVKRVHGEMREALPRVAGR